MKTTNIAKQKINMKKKRKDLYIRSHEEEVVTRRISRKTKDNTMSKKKMEESDTQTEKMKQLEKSKMKMKTMSSTR